jgi:erythromycin esterase-like protein
MGDYLNQRYGDQLVVFGFLFYHGSFHAMGVGSQSVVETFHAAEPPGDSYEFRFQAAGVPRFFLDMRQARSDSSDQAWLFTPHPFYEVGGLYDPNNPSFFPAPLARIFDVVIYFKDTTPSLLLAH